MGLKKVPFVFNDYTIGRQGANFMTSHCGSVVRNFPSAAEFPARHWKQVFTTKSLHRSEHRRKTNSAGKR
jgi:hypothetical protein